jgi:hypothetical protein
VPNQYANTFARPVVSEPSMSSSAWLSFTFSTPNIMPPRSTKKPIVMTVLRSAGTIERVAICMSRALLRSPAAIASRSAAFLKPSSAMRSACASSAFLKSAALITPCSNRLPILATAPLMPSGPACASVICVAASGETALITADTGREFRAEHALELGGPEQCTLAQAHARYAQLYSPRKRGAQQELTRISHYLEAAGLPPLRLGTNDKGKRDIIECKNAELDARVAKGWQGYLAKRRARSARTYTCIAMLARMRVASMALTTITLRASTSRFRERPGNLAWSDAGPRPS